MIRINLLKPAHGAAEPAPAREPRGSVWIHRSEVWTGLVLLVLAGGLLFYLTSRNGSRTDRAPTSAQALEAAGRPLAAGAAIPTPQEAPPGNAAADPERLPGSAAQQSGARSSATQAPTALPPALAPPAVTSAKPAPTTAAPPLDPPAAPSAKQTSTTPATQPTPATGIIANERPTHGFQLSQVSIRQQPRGLNVALRVGPGVSYRATKLESPNRLVIDLQDCRLSIPPGQNSQTLNHPRVRRVRASQFQVDPAISRVVLDVTVFPRYEIHPNPDGLEIQVLDGDQ